MKEKRGSFEMKCPGCGAETQGRLCEYCGSEMPQAQPNINIINNYYNVTHTPQAAECTVTEHAPKKSRKTWLWVLGWICIFPLPLMLLLLRKKEMNPFLKYGIIVFAWVVYFLIGVSGY